MVDTAFHLKRRPSYRYLEAQEEDDVLEIVLPSNRPPSYAKRVRVGRFLYIIEAKQARKALLDASGRVYVDDHSSDEGDADSAIDWNVRHWNRYDFIGAIGLLLMLAGVILVSLPSTQTYGALFPIGAACAAFAAYGARHREAYTH